MTYKRRIAYFDYMECGKKKGNAGFCKWQQQNGIHALEISISGLKETRIEKVNIFTKTGSELGNLQLHNGRAVAVFSKKSGEGNWDWEFTQIRIPLSAERELVAEFPVEQNAQQSVKKVKEQNVQQSVEKVKEQNVQQTIEKKEEKPLVQKLEAMVKELTAKREFVKESERMEEESKVLGLSDEVEENKELGRGIRAAEQIEMVEAASAFSLWDWLEQTHEKIQPFGTQEEYFRIMVEDIYRLKEEYHILRNNQFLLHGYYNYKYLILGKKGGESEEYWLGVPGIYHEREKMAARMYGFEKFEGAKPRYGVGDLGYYLITTE